MSGRRLLGGAGLAVMLTAGCSQAAGAPEVAAVVEGTEIPAAETEALLRDHLQRLGAEEDAGEHTYDEERRRTLRRFVLLYQIKHTVLRHLAREMDIPGHPNGDPAVEAGRLSRAIATRLFPDVSVRDEMVEPAGLAVEQQRQSLFSQWFDKKLRAAEVWVDRYYGRWDADRGVVQ